MICKQIKQPSADHGGKQGEYLVDGSQDECKEDKPAIRSYIMQQNFHDNPGGGFLAYYGDKAVKLR